MKLKTVLPLVVFATLAVPMTAQAQGTVRGAEEGAAVGDRDAGPLGQSSGARLAVARRRHVTAGEERPDPPIDVVKNGCLTRELQPHR
jgi:hypothetical protein